MGLFLSGVSVSHENDTVQDPETEAAKWFLLLLYTYVFSSCDMTECFQSKRSMSAKRH